MIFRKIVLKRVQTSLQFNFCEIVNTFRSRSKLTEFYKHTHPDILSNAPEHVKEENLRSIKLLNQYLDQLSQNKGCENLMLKFYIAEKNNKKSRKFFLFEALLTPLKPDVSKDLMQIHLDKCVQILLNQLKQSKEQTDPALKNKATQEIQQPGRLGFDSKYNQEKLFQDYQYTMQPLRKDHFNPDKDFTDTRELLNTRVFMTLSEIKKQDLLQKIHSQMFVQDSMPKSKALMWSKMILDQTKYHDNLIELFESLIDPRLIFIDEKINNDQMESFIKKLLPIDKSRSQAKKSKQLREIFSEMESSDPQIFLYISDKYSIDDIPGYISIPFEFEVEEFHKFFENNKYDVIEQRLQIEKLYERIEVVQQEIFSISEIRSINLLQEVTLQSLDKQLLCLKRILQIIKKILVNFKQIQIIPVNQKILIKSNILQLPLQFNEIELYKCIQQQC